MLLGSEGLPEGKADWVGGEEGWVGHGVSGGQLGVHGGRWSGLCSCVGCDGDWREVKLDSSWELVLLVVVVHLLHLYCIPLLQYILQFRAKT